MIIFKMHHVLADGYGMITFYRNLADNAEEINLAHLRRQTCFEKILIFMTLPWHFLSISFKLIFSRKNINPLAIDVPSSGLKKGVFAKEYRISDIKSKCKEHGVTFNDLIITVVSMTIKKFF